MTEQAKVALVTGASGGIGRETARALAAAGWTVYAGSRTPEALAALEPDGPRPVPLDVTDDASMRAAVERVLAETGRLDLLVNNAGYGLYGPLEELDLDDLRRQFETNVIGLIRMCQLVLPAMRRQGRGRIVNIGSMGGVISTPMGGAYHATKFALEAVSDVLRVEVAPFGVDVVLVRPGSVRTGFMPTILASMPRTGESSPYAAHKRGFARAMAFIEQAPGVLEPAAVARVIVRAATAAHPRARYKAGASAYALVALRRLLPDRAWDALMLRALARATRAAEAEAAAPDAVPAAG
jgi:NAD(P)-dependent dehydrogenase (short-subunit alcohol dehydrogenase family)